MKVLLSGFSEKIPADWKDLIQDVDFAYHPINPENHDEVITAVGLKPLMDIAKADDLDMIIFCDPASNRIILSSRKSVTGAFIFFNHNQLAAVLSSLWVKIESGNPLKCIKSVFISKMVEELCTKNGVKCNNYYDFTEKLPDAINKRYLKNEKREYFGFDNDQGVFHTRFSTLEIVGQLIQLEHIQQESEMTTFDYLISLYQQYGFYKSKTVSVDYSDQTHKQNYLSLLDKIKKQPASINYILNIEKLVDFKKGVKKNLLTGKAIEFSTPQLDLLKIQTDTNLTLYLSVQAEKMVFYISAKNSLSSKETYGDISKAVDMEMIRIVQVLNKLLVTL